MQPPMKPISGWGRFPVVPGHERVAEDLETASTGVALTRGLGRSYGDASLPVPGDTVLCTRRADRILRFDALTGVLRAEAGFSLWQLNQVFPRRGFASPVQPGTSYITLGGMVASVVHGTNEHVAG
jgi:FAD/FMN-containing dehydrogenase